MLKQFLKDSVIYTFTTVFSKGISILLLPLYTRFLSTEQYGTLDLLTVATSLINLTVALEISQGLARYYSEQKSITEKSSYASTALWFTLFSYIIFIVTCLFFTDPICLWFTDSTEANDLIRYYLVGLLFKGLFLITSHQLRWMLMAKQCAIGSLIYSISLALSAAFFLFVCNLSIKGIIFAEIVGALIATIYTLFTIGKLYRFELNTSALMKMLKFSTPLIPSSIGVFVALYIDRIILKETLNLSQVAIYGIGVKFAMIVTLLVTGFQKSLTPLIYSQYELKETAVNIAKLLRYFLIFAFVLVTFLTVFAGEILAIFTTSQYYSSITIIPWLATATLISQMYIFTPGLAIAKKTGTITILNLSGASINLLLNLLLIPQFGINGAAIATLISSILVFCGYSYCSQRYYFIPHQWGKLIFFLASTILVAISGYFIPAVNTLSYVQIVIKTILVAVISILFFSFFTKREEQHKLYLFIKSYLKLFTRKVS